MDKEDMKLGQQYPMTDVEADRKTKDKILLTAVIMFAKNGYEGTSVKDITSELGITPATLYNHYVGKEGLWDAVLDQAEHLYMLYFQRLQKAIDACDSFETMVDAMFEELLDVVNIYTYYCFGVVQTEHFRDEKAARIYCDVFLKYSIDFIASHFQTAVDNGWAEPFDTKATATVFMHTVLIGMTVRVQEDMGRDTPYNVSEMFLGMKRQIINQRVGSLAV